MANTVPSKSQVTIPKSVRDWLGIRAGSAVAIEFSDPDEVVLRLAPAPTSRFAELRGRATVKLRTEEIMALTCGRS